MVQQMCDSFLIFHKNFKKVFKLHNAILWHFYLVGPYLVVTYLVGPIIIIFRPVVTMNELFVNLSLKSFKYVIKKFQTVSKIFFKKSRL